MQGGLWLAGLSMDSEAAELMALENYAGERVTFGVDSGAAVTVVTKDTASDYPRQAGAGKRMTDCQGNVVKDMGEKDLQLTTASGGIKFARVTVAPVAKNFLAASSLLASGHEVVFKKEDSYILHRGSGRKQVLAQHNGVFEVTYALTPYASRAVPPRRTL